MPNTYFRFKQFTVHHERCAMKVTTDACVFGAWVAREMLALEKRMPHSLDIGTGTGLLSLMIAQKNKGLIDAIEIDASAAQQANENVSASPWKEQIHVIHQDLLQWQTSTKYNCIFSNPPFYENDLKSGKEKRNVAHHDKGLKLAELLCFIKEHLSEEGLFFLLFPAKREDELRQQLRQTNLYLHRKVYVKQTLKHQPFRLMIQGSVKSCDETIVQEITIRQTEKEYTPEATSLLKDYYLYL